MPQRLRGPRDFWRRVSKPRRGCWLWLGAKTGNGYGNLKYRREFWVAHRLVYTMLYGAVPCGRIVMHRCDNRICVRPSHLRLGTQLENMHDMRAKGRGTKGETHPNAKLSDRDIKRAVLLARHGRRQKVVAKHFGISESHMSDLIHRKTRLSAFG